MNIFFSKFENKRKKNWIKINLLILLVTSLFEKFALKIELQSIFFSCSISLSLYFLNLKLI